MKRLVVLLAAFLSSGLAAELPVRQIVLYKSGVGYFERAGMLSAGESARLDFDASQMNDVLKSLTVQDRGGAKITALRYDSSEPLANKLAEFPFQIGDQQALSAFLDHMKGARIEIKYGSETASGAIVSARVIPGGDKAAEHQQLVLLLDSGELRALDLNAVLSIRFEDPKLQGQLRDYLTVVNQSRSTNKRSVYIDSTDSKSRELTASYMVPMPVWKSSYRLLFQDQGEPLMEGWAIVDNTTGEDWMNVQLAVVSGRPVSFITQLYEAKFLQRPTVELPEDRAVAPKLHEGAIEEEAQAQRPVAGLREGFGAGHGGVIGSSLGSGLGGGFGPGVYAPGPSSVASTAEGTDLGGLFEYSFSSPVTVKKNESAMLPFLQQKLGARKLLIYSQSYGLHPMSAAELTNSTGKTLDGGPITIFDSNNYAGEALMETLPAGDKRLISYAVDLGTRVGTAFESSRAVVREVHLNRGMLTTKSAIDETRTYTIRNTDARPKTLIIEHPLRPGYQLLNQKPSETTSNAYRFEVKLAPDATEKFPVSEERVLTSTLAVSSVTPDTLLAYVQNKTLPDSTRRPLQQILDQKKQISGLDDKISGAESQIADLSKDEDRMRQNIVSLNTVSGQQEIVQKYSHDLAGLETQLGSLRDTLTNLRMQRDAADAALKNLIDQLEF